MVAARMACSTAARIDQERAIPSLETLSSAQYVTPCAAAQSCALARTSERRTEQFLRQRPAANGYRRIGMPLTVESKRAGRSYWKAQPLIIAKAGGQKPDN